jgi:glycosyltransferase involved in cell wall biosynthesis
MYRGQRISVVLPTYNEKDSIRKVIGDFEELGIVDEILVINNNAAAGTSEEVRPTSAREIHEPVQGYGAAIQRGFAESTGDLVVVCEPDDTFLARDLHKFLAYAEDVDIVYGSRTVKTFIWERANMGFLLKWGNWAVAKLMEVLFNTNYLSDVGCTYRMIRRTALLGMLGTFEVRSNFFGPEMMVRGYRMRFRCLQIPVNYKDRVGQSSVTGDFRKAAVLGLQMIVLIIAMRFGLERWLRRLLK